MDGHNLFKDIFASLSLWIFLFYIINPFFFLLKKLSRIRIFYLRPETFIFTSNAARISRKDGHSWLGALQSESKLYYLGARSFQKWELPFKVNTILAFMNIKYIHLISESKNGILMIVLWVDEYFRVFISYIPYLYIYI